jgi:hypothetical protein
MEEGKGDNNSLSVAIVGRGDSTLDMTVCGGCGVEWRGAFGQRLPSDKVAVACIVQRCTLSMDSRWRKKTVTWS